MMVKIYAAEVATTAMKVNLFNPNRTRTSMRAEAYPGENPETVKSPDDAARQMLELVLPGCTKNGETIDAVETSQG